MREQIGIVSVPPLQIIRLLNSEQAAIVDLNEPQCVLPIDQRDQ